MPEIDARLREDVHQLGELLGDTIREQYGPRFLDKIELIRKGRQGCPPRFRGGRPAAHRHPRRARGRRTAAGGAGLQPVPQPGQYRRAIPPYPPAPAERAGTLREPGAGRAAGASQGRRACPGQLARQLAGLEIELVLTAHPTEVARRTLIQKYDAITAQLAARTMPTCCRRSAVASSSACSGWWPRPGIPTRSARSGRPRWTRRNGASR